MDTIMTIVVGILVACFAFMSVFENIVRGKNGETSKTTNP